jgi:hypothetical protein
MSTSIYQSTSGDWIYFDGLVKHTGLTEAEAQQMSRENDYIGEARAAAREVWDGISKLKALQREYNALDYGTTLDTGAGDNAGITAAQVGAVVFDTANALETVLAAGHATNLAKLL